MTEQEKERTLFADFPDLPPITDATRAENTNRGIRGSVRINNGWYRTDAENKEYRERSMARKLP